MPIAARTRATAAKASKSTSEKRRSDAEAESSSSMVATRTAGWFLSIDQIAWRIDGASDAGALLVLTTSESARSNQIHCAAGKYTASGRLAASEAWVTSATTPTITPPRGPDA